MVDIHSHLLPSYDDGPDSLDKSLEAVKNVIDAQVGTIVLTPHFIFEHYKDTFDYRQKQFEIFKKKIKEISDINVFISAEIFLFEGLSNQIKNFPICYPDTQYILIETNMGQKPEYFEEEIYKIHLSGYKTILAHPERYEWVKRDPEKVLELMHRDIYLQVNAGSLLGNYGKEAKKTAWNLLENGYVHFMASDYHGKGDYSYFLEAYNVVEKKIDKYTADLLFLKNPRKMLENKNIKMFYVEKMEVEKSNFFRRLFRLNER